MRSYGKVQEISETTTVIPARAFDGRTLAITSYRYLQWHQSAMAGIDHTLLNLIVVDSVIEMRRNPELAPRRSVDLWTSGLLQRA